VTVNQVQGSVVTPPGPGGFSAPAVFSAPQARGLMSATATSGPQAGATASGANANTTINIQVGVGDADQIARTVKRVLIGRDRRTGSIMSGGVRTAL